MFCVSVFVFVQICAFVCLAEICIHQRHTGSRIYWPVSNINPFQSYVWWSEGHRNNPKNLLKVTYTHVFTQKQSLK